MFGEAFGAVSLFTRSETGQLEAPATESQSYSLGYSSNESTWFTFMAGLLIILLVAIFVPPVSALGWIIFGIWLFQRKFKAVAILCIPFPVVSVAMMKPSSFGLDIFQSYGFFGRHAFEFWIASSTLLASGWVLMHFVHAQLQTNRS